jgi:uncharacterized damage-inducible protein DinB
MKELLDQYARYNAWAHKKLLARINALNKRQQHQEVASSFNSLYKTVFHVWGASSVWFNRLSHENFRINGDPFNGLMSDLSIALEKSDEQWMSWTLNTEENALKEKLAYSNSKGEPFNQPLNQILMHVFNHSTYHNGQIVTMLRQLKIENIPATDFIAWTREEL